jgi:hypothetical protein
MIQMKSLKAEAIPAALELARRYRLLNEPDETESICRDILAVAPDHQDALITLLLALTDKFGDHSLQPSFEQAREIVARLDSSYCKAYYSGIIFERRAKYHLKQETPMAGVLAHSWFVKAMRAYGEALAGCDPDNQDAVLRWNSCARFINNHPDVKPDDSDRSEMLLDPFDTPH